MGFTVAPGCLQGGKEARWSPCLRGWNGAGRNKVPTEVSTPDGEPTFLQPLTPPAWGLGCEWGLDEDGVCVHMYTSLHPPMPLIM